MSEPDDVTVDADGVSVRKTLNDHQFETLAVVFDIRSGREHAAGVTLTDAIPDGVAVDDIGFHPEYGGEHWRADGETVVFSRTFEPGEQYTTVYGVRGLDDDPETLLAEPGVEVDEEAVGGIEGIDDLVSESDSDLVREVISGERDTLPSLEDDADEGEDVEAEPTPVEATVGGDEEPIAAEAAVGDIDADAEVEVDVAADDAPGVDDTEPVVDDEEVAEEKPAAKPPVGGPPSPNVTIGGGPTDAESEADEAADDEDVEATVGAEAVSDMPDDKEEVEPETEAPETDVEPVEEPDAEEVEEMDQVDDSEETEPDADQDDEITVPVTGGIARVLAKELRAGNVSYDDRRLLREELLPDDGSTDARIKRLQTQMADLEAYTESLEQFLDAEGGAEAVIADLEAEIDDLAGDVAAVEGSVSGVEDAVGDVEADVEVVAGDVAAVEGDLDEVTADVDDVSGSVARLENEVESVKDDVDQIDALGRRLESVEDDVAAIHDELAELATFRDRLSSVFGAGGGPGGPGTAPDDSDASSGDDGGYGGY